VTDFSQGSFLVEVFLVGEQGLIIGMYYLNRF
jgi:hypothetical protein